MAAVWSASSGCCATKGDGSSDLGPFGRAAVVDDARDPRAGEQGGIVDRVTIVCTATRVDRYYVFQSRRADDRCVSSDRTPTAVGVWKLFRISSCLVPDRHAIGQQSWNHRAILLTL